MSGNGQRPRTFYVSWTFVIPGQVLFPLIVWEIDGQSVNLVNTYTHTLVIILWKVCKFHTFHSSPTLAVCSGPARRRRLGEPWSPTVEYWCLWWIRVVRRSSPPASCRRSLTSIVTTPPGMWLTSPHSLASSKLWRMTRCWGEWMGREEGIEWRFYVCVCVYFCICVCVNIYKQNLIRYILNHVASMEILKSWKIDFCEWLINAHYLLSCAEHTVLPCYRRGLHSLDGCL